MINEDGRAASGIPRTALRGFIVFVLVLLSTLAGAMATPSPLQGWIVLFGVSVASAVFVITFLRLCKIDLAEKSSHQQGGSAQEEN